MYISGGDVSLETEGYCIPGGVERMRVGQYPGNYSPDQSQYTPTDILHMLVCLEMPGVD